MKNLLLSFVLILGIISCSKKNIEVEQDPGFLEGFSGNILTLDEYESPLPNQREGVSVEVEGSSPVIRVVTNDEGNFLLPQLDASKDLVVTFSKPGFGTHKEYLSQSTIAQLNAGKPQISGIIREVSPVVVKSLSATTGGSDTVQLVVNVSFPQTNAPKYIRFIMSTEPDVSLLKVTSLLKNVSSHFEVKNGANAITFTKSGLKKCGYESGDKVYLKAYGGTANTPNYVELPSNRIVLTSMNPVSEADVISFSIP